MQNFVKLECLEVAILKNPIFRDFSLYFFKPDQLCQFVLDLVSQTNV